MIAARNPIAREQRAGSLIRLEDGTRIRPEEIVTVAQGLALLDEVGRVVADIERQLDDDLTRPDDPGWWARAEYALKCQRRASAVIQQRVAQLRQFEKGCLTPAAERCNQRRVAFINAAESMLDRELFVEIWQRASEAEPTAFEGWKGVAS